RFADDLERSALQRPIHRADRHRPLAERIPAAAIAGESHLDPKHRTVRKTADKRFAIVDIQTVVGRAFPLPGAARAGQLVRAGRAVGSVAARTGGHVELIVDFREATRIQGAVKAGSGLRERGRNDELTDQRPVWEIVERGVVQQIELADRQQEDASAQVERFLDEIVDVRELESELHLAVGSADLTDAVLNLEL